jgi:hypothetical protein
MKAPILVVRTVSVEKFSPVLDACHTRWPHHPLLVVTNSTRGSELRMVTPIPCDHALEAVVVPVGNRGGSGYANVMRACRDLRARTWFLAAYSRELNELTAQQWTRRWRTEFALQVPARWLAWGWARLIIRDGKSA